MSEPLVMRRTLSKRLSRTILLLAAPLFVLSLGVFYQYARELLHREALERSRTTLSTTTQLVENYLSTIETAAKSYVWMLEENFSPDSLPALAHRLVSLNGSVLSCSVATEPDAFPEYGDRFSVYSVRDGDTVVTALEPEFEYFQKNWYKKPMQAGQPCWINPFSDFNKGTINHHDAVGSFCMPLRPHGNRIEGVVSVDFSFQELRRTVLATHHPYPSSYYMLLGPAGGYLIHPDNSLLFKKTIFTATDSVEHPDIIALGRAMTGGKYGMMHVNMDGVLCHVTYMPVSDSRWSIALVCDDDDVLADYNHLAIILIVFVVIGLLIIAWITRIVVQRNIRPLNELMEATKKVAEGNYDTEIPVTGHKDVIGKMQNAFHDMQQALLSRQEDIRKNDAEIAAESAELESSLPLAREASQRRQRFIHRVSRQISAPLNVIEGLARVLQDRVAARQHARAGESGQTATVPERTQAADDIRQISSTMKHNAILLYRNTLMLYDISDTGAADSTRYRRTGVVKCNEMAREGANAIKELFEGVNIRVETELPDSMAIRTSQMFLSLTVKELLYNAAKYSDGQHIVLRLSQNGASVRIVVEDVGPGLPEELRESVLVPFTKVDDLSEGLGLGLPLCKAHAEGLGGSIVYDESYRQGCRFILEVPAG